MLTYQDTTRFDFKDAEFIREFPAILRCALRCENGINTGEDLEGASEHSGSAGMCQLYKGKNGYFAMFFAEDYTIITTVQGSYHNEGAFHSFKSDCGLFVFEEDATRSEEAICTMIDVEYGLRKLKQQRILEKFLENFTPEEKN